MIFYVSTDLDLTCSFGIVFAFVSVYKLLISKFPKLK